MKQRKRRRPVFSHTFGLLSVLLLVVFLIYNAGLFCFVKDSYEDFMFRNNEKLLSQTVTYFDYVIDTVKSETQLLSENTDVMYTAGRPSADQYVRNRNVMNSLKNIARNNRYVSSSGLYIVKNGYYLGSDGTIGTGAAPAEDNLAGFLEEPERKRGLYSLGKALYYISDFPQDRSFPLGYIVLKLEKDSFLSLLGAHSAASGEGFYLLGSDGRLLLKADSLKEEVVLERFGDVDLPEDGKHILFRSRYYFLCRSRVENLDYLYVISASKFILEGGMVRSFLAPMLLVITVLIIGFSYVASRRISAPIQGLVKKITEKHSEASVKNEYQLLEDYLSYLVQKSGQTSQKLTSLRPMMMEALYYNLLQGITVDYRASIEMEQFLEIGQLEEKGYLVGVFSPNRQNENTDAAPRKELEYFSRFIRDGNHEMECLGFQIDESSLILLMIIAQWREDTLEEAYSLCLRTSQQLEQTLGMTYTVGISGPAERLNQIRTGYLQALEALKQRLYYPPGAVITYQERTEENAGEHTELLEKAETRLLNAVSAGTRELVKGFLEEMEQYLRAVSGAERRYVITYLVSFLKKLSALSIRDPLEAGRLKDGTLQYQLLDRFATLEEMLHYVEQCCYNVMEKEVDPDEDRRKEHVRRALSYVKENYQDPELSLSGTAEHLGLSRSYVSTLFKKECKISYVEYVSKIRIEKAKELLAGTNLPIREIGELVGCGSTQNFIRIFGKLEGITPSQYRSAVKRQQK